MRSGGIRLAGVLVGAAFIGAALVACEEPAGELVAPQSDGAVFAKPGACPGHPSCDGGGDGGDGGGSDPGSETYDYIFSAFAAVNTDPNPGFATTNVGGGDADDLVMDGCCGTPEEEETLILSEDFLGVLETGVCFTPLESGTFRTQFSGAMRRDKKNDLGVDATFFFTAFDGAGTSEVKYVLTLHGEVSKSSDEDGLFPPEPGETTSIRFDTADLETEGKGQTKKGACAAEGLDLNALSGGTSVNVEGGADGAVGHS